MEAGFQARASYADILGQEPGKEVHLGDSQQTSWSQCLERAGQDVPGISHVMQRGGCHGEGMVRWDTGPVAMAVTECGIRYARGRPPMGVHDTEQPGKWRDAGELFGGKVAVEFGEQGIGTVGATDPVRRSAVFPP